MVECFSVKQTLESCWRSSLPQTKCLDAISSHEHGAIYDGWLVVFSARMQKATQQLQDPSQLRKLRRDIARVHTVMAEKAAKQ